MSKLIFLFIGLLAMAGRVEAKSASENQGVREMVDSLTRQAMCKRPNLGPSLIWLR